MALVRNLRFIWKKKIEKQIDDGVALADLSAKAELSKQNERLVSLGPLSLVVMSLTLVLQSIGMRFYTSGIQHTLSCCFLDLLIVEQQLLR